MPWAAYAGIAGLIASAILIVIAIVNGGLGSISWWTLASILVSGAVVIVTLQAGAMRNVYPPINDISTDTINPPAFVAALPLRLADGGSDGVYKPQTAEVQKKSYPYIAPLKLAISQADAFQQAAAVAVRMPGWRIATVELGAGRLEASQESCWFGFVDDVVIRVSATDAGSRVDVRSASRHGRSDASMPNGCVPISMRVVSR